MQIYFSREVPTHFDIYRAGADAGMDIDNVREFTPRDDRFIGGWSFNGYGGNQYHSARRPNTRDSYVRKVEYAASWDQWGVLLSNILHVDPEAFIGGVKYSYYAGSDDFHRKTGDRFKRVSTIEDLITAAMQRGEPGFHDHVFRYDPALGGFTQFVHRCIKGRDGSGNQCGAVKVRG